MIGTNENRGGASCGGHLLERQRKRPQPGQWVLSPFYGYWNYGISGCMLSDGTGVYI